MFDSERLRELKKYTYAVYILQALSFVLLITAPIGVIVNYVKDDEVRGSWLESHFRWQKATFWYGLLWTLLGIILNRLNVCIIAFNWNLPPAQRYYPSWMEVVTSVFIVTIGILAYRFCAARMPILYEHPDYPYEP